MKDKRMQTRQSGERIFAIIGVNYLAADRVWWLSRCSKFLLNHDDPPTIHAYFIGLRVNGDENAVKTSFSSHGSVHGCHRGAYPPSSCSQPPLNIRLYIIRRLRRGGEQIIRPRAPRKIDKLYYINNDRAWRRCYPAIR